MKKTLIGFVRTEKGLKLFYDAKELEDFLKDLQRKSEVIPGNKSGSRSH